MYFLLILPAIACLFPAISLGRLCAAIRSVCRQLAGIERGSHMELTADTRQKPLLELCRSLNRIIAAKDRNHLRYERAEKQLKQNITNLAHDIRTPLTGASGYLQLARECEDAAKRDHYLSAADRRMAELTDMLDKLFLYTKLVNDNFTFPGENMKKLQVLPLLSDCLLSFYTEFEELKTSPEVRFDSEGFRVTADEDALRRIFMNLLQNALLHGAGGLTVTQKADSGCLIFENPVPEDITLDVSQIFDLFYKADTARWKGSSGLGMFIVRELMRRMGGDVDAELDGNMLRIILRFPPDASVPDSRCADRFLLE